MLGADLVFLESSFLMNSDTTTISIDDSATVSFDTIHSFFLPNSRLPPTQRLFSVINLTSGDLIQSG